MLANEEFEHAVDDVQLADALRIELLHDVEELPQDARAREISSVCRRVRVRDARTRVSITMAPACGARANDARERGACAYLVVNLRLPLELHLDLAQIRDGVLSRWAAGCHGHGAARERALRLVLAARTTHRRSTLGAGTLHRGVVEGGGAGGNVAVWHSPRSAVCSSAALAARAKPRFLPVPLEN